MIENDDTYFRRRAQQQLDVAAHAANPAIRAIHLDLASRYATLGEHAQRSISAVVSEVANVREFRTVSEPSSATTDLGN